MPWPWDPPPPALDAVSTTHDDNRSTKLLDSTSKHARDIFVQSRGHLSTFLQDEDDTQAQENSPTLGLGNFGTVLSFLHLEKMHSSMWHPANTSASYEHHHHHHHRHAGTAPSALEVAVTEPSGLWDLSMAMRYLEAHRTLHHPEPTTALYSEPPLTVTATKDLGSHTWVTRFDLTDETCHNDVGMTTSADISVNHTDDGATTLITLHDQSQGTKSNHPGNDGLVEPAGARRRVKKKSVRTMPIDEPTSSSNGAGHSSESEHKDSTEPASGPDDHSDTSNHCSKPSVSDKQVPDLNVPSRAPEPVQTLSTPNTVIKKKRPWRAAKVLKEMKALFLAEHQEQQELYARQKIHCQEIVDRQKRGDSMGQVLRRKSCGIVSRNGLVPIAPVEEQESVIEHTPGCEPLIIQRPRSHYKNFWRPWEQDSTMENGPTLPSLACTTFAPTTSTLSLSEEQCAGKKLLAMRVRDTFLVPNGVSHLENALSQARTDVHVEAEQQTDFIEKDKATGEDDGGDDDDVAEEGRPSPETGFNEGFKTAFTHEKDTKVAPSDRVFIFVDNSNILTGFYQHHQMHCSPQKVQAPASEAPSAETVQRSPSASTLPTPQAAPSNTPEKQDCADMDTDSDEETVLYPCPMRDRAKLAKVPTDENAKDKTKDVPLVTEITTGDNHDGPPVSTATAEDSSKSYKTPTAPSGAKMVRDSHLLPKFDYNKFFELLRKNRPTARQVLVGSSPLFQELDEALEHQYETIILRRVRKFVQGELGALPVPVKQPRYPSNNSNNNNNNNTAVLPGSSGCAADSLLASSASRIDTDATSQAKSLSQIPATGDVGTLQPTAITTPTSAPMPVPAAVANGEQGVDELLHLKMLETLLDHEPATMVLATGDGGDSEFGGGGFYGVIRRALDRGWQVEVVSWEDLLSGAYLDLALEYGYIDPDHRPKSTSRQHCSSFRSAQPQQQQQLHRYHHHHHHQQQHQHHHRVPKTRLPLQRRSAYAEGRRMQGHLRVWCLDWYGDLFLQK